MKEQFDTLHKIMAGLDQLEGELKALRDRVDLGTKKSINGSLAAAGLFRDELWKVDKSLENEAQG